MSLTDLELMNIKNEISDETIYNEIVKINECKKSCTKKFTNVLKVAFSDLNHYERFENIC